MATHRGESCTDSTISSPSVTDSSPERVSSPRTQIHSSPGKNPPPTVTTTPPFKQLAPPVDNLPQGSETTPPPVTIRRLSPPGLGASSLSEPTYIKSSASPFVEVPSKSNHEISSPKSRSNGLPQPFVTPTNRDPPTPPDQVRIRNVFKPGTRTNPLDPLDTLHPILASIEPEYSSFYPSGTHVITGVLAAYCNPPFQSCSNLNTRLPPTHSTLGNRVISSCVIRPEEARSTEYRHPTQESLPRGSGILLPVGPRLASSGIGEL